jgi:hypothetical protein
VIGSLLLRQKVVVPQLLQLRHQILENHPDTHPYQEKFEIEPFYNSGTNPAFPLA